jgi:hypothetical protein
MEDDAEHVEVIRTVLAEPAEFRGRALADAVVELGPSFVNTLSLVSASPAAAQLSLDQNAIADLARRAAEIVNAWLTGKRITSRADESERRVLAIKRLAAADPGDTLLARLAADAMLRLPAGSEQRDLAFAREVLLRQVTLARRPSGDVMTCSWRVITSCTTTC